LNIIQNSNFKKSSPFTNSLSALQWALASLNLCIRKQFFKNVPSFFTLLSFCNPKIKNKNQRYLPVVPFFNFSPLVIVLILVPCNPLKPLTLFYPPIILADTDTHRDPRTQTNCNCSFANVPEKCTKSHKKPNWKRVRVKIRETQIQNPKSIITRCTVVRPYPIRFCDFAQLINHLTNCRDANE